MTTTDNASAERDLFNRWYNPYEFRKQYDKYGPTEVAWTIWQAALASRATSTEDGRFLSWLADRLVHVYKENPNLDFVHATRRIAARLMSTQGDKP
jgi:hypothetical protein